mgnify:CR=1 FL=1
MGGITSSAPATAITDAVREQRVLPLCGVGLVGVPAIRADAVTVADELPTGLSYASHTLIATCPAIG